MLPANLKRTFHELGLANGAIYLAGRLLQRLSADRARIIRYKLVAQPVPQTPSRPPRAATKCRIRTINANDAVVSAFPRPPQVISRRFADGATCFVAEVGDRFAGFLWLARNAYEEDEVRCRFELFPPELCAWDFDVYVEPDFRIGRTFSRLWEAANAHLSAQGVLWSLSRISAFNPESLAAHRRLGIREVGMATFLVFGSVQLSLYGKAPFLSISSSPLRRPRFRLSPPTGQK
jgi:GNAT superfamily N-acetyltransferase